MTDYRLVFRPEALHQLQSLYDYIADAGSPETAARYTESVVAYCETLTEFPNRGIPRNDIHPGLRIIGYRKKTVIAFTIIDESIIVIGVLHGGSDYESTLEATN